MSSINLEDLIPKTKFDTDKLIELDLLSSEEIAPILPELLAWMRDMNWPVAREMSQLLAKHQKLLVPHIIDALAAEQDECDWKNIICDLSSLLDEKYLILFLPYYGDAPEDYEAVKKGTEMWNGTNHCVE